MGPFDGPHFDRVPGYSHTRPYFNMALTNLFVIVVIRYNPKYLHTKMVILDQKIQLYFFIKATTLL